MVIKNNIRESFNLLYQWIKNNGWAGYDPYDIKASPIIIRLIQKSRDSFIYTLLRELVFESFFMFPGLSRKLLKIKPGINAKAMGLLADAFLDTYLFTQDKQFLTNADMCLDWLIQHPSVTPIGKAWGYPFDWESTVFIPAKTPNGIVTTAVGEAFWKRYQMNQDTNDLEILKQIGEFLAGLPKDHFSDQSICFSYTPLSRNHVHNLNLFVAEFLLKVGMEIHRKEWIRLAHKAVTYTLADQHANGSFDYNGPPEPPAHFVDHYHTGFVLRMLYSILKLTGRDDVEKALRKGYQFYIDNFFDGPVPKLKPHQKHRIDIHSCTEAIICLCTLENIFPDSCKKAETVLEWTIDNLQDSSGYFYYGILKSRICGITWKSKIPYFRWGQAWMMKAFATYLRNTSANLNLHA